MQTLNAFSLLATGLPKRSGQLVAFHWQDRLRESEYFPLYAEATYLKKKKSYTEVTYLKINKAN